MSTGKATCMAAVLFLALQLASPYASAQPSGSPADFTTYSLEELMAMEITSAAKKPQKAYESAAAVYVITQEDIRRSGAVNLPEALRMAPGIQVLRSDPGAFAVTSRGFLGKYANKLLVMIDGRSIYTPTYSGVAWVYDDLLLENIERIEVIRGPGATLWGANAVNGVINIITKSARDMQGGMGVAAVGDQEGYDGLRYGARLRDGMYLAAYGKYMHFGNVVNDAFDDRRQKSMGVRLDWAATASDQLLVTMRYYDNDDSNRSRRPLVLPPLDDPEVSSRANTKGGHVLVRWNHAFSPTSAMSLKLYHNNFYARAKRATGCVAARSSDDLRGDVFRESTTDMDFQHSFALGSRHSMLWGLNARYSRAHKRERSFYYTLARPTEGRRLYSFFVQDEIALDPERLSLLLGSKFEYNSYTQLEVQPSVRLLYTPSKTQSLWCAVSRAVRTPSFLETAGRIPSAFVGRGGLFPLSPPALAMLEGNSDYGSESLIAYEAGHRVQLFRSITLDSALFYNVYHDLRSLEPEAPRLKRGYLYIPVRADNNMRGRTYGAELAAAWQVLPRWRLLASYSYLRMNLTPKKNSGDALSEYDEDLSSQHLVNLRSLYSITPSLECDVGLYFADRIERLNNPSHADLTVRLGWRPVRQLTLEAIGYNLIDNKYSGFRDEIYDRGQNQVRRTFYGRITVEF